MTELNVCIENALSSVGIRIFCEGLFWAKKTYWDRKIKILNIKISFGINLIRHRKIGKHDVEDCQPGIEDFSY